MSWAGQLSHSAGTVFGMDWRTEPGPVPQHRRRVNVSPERQDSAADTTGYAVVQLRNAGLMQVLDDVEQRLDSMLDSDPHTLIIDMSEVGQLSSTTIAALLWVRRRCSVRGVDVVLHGASRRHVDMLQRIRLLGGLVPEPMARWPGSSRTDADRLRRLR